MWGLLPGHAVPGPTGSGMLGLPTPYWASRGEKESEFLHALHLNIPPPNPACCGSIQLASHSRLTSITCIISLHSLSAPPLATMIQKQLGGFSSLVQGHNVCPGQTSPCSPPQYTFAVIFQSIHTLHKLPLAVLQMKLVVYPHGGGRRSFMLSW